MGLEVGSFDGFPLALDRASLLREMVAPSPWQPGQLLFAGFEGREVPGYLARRIASGRIGGVVLFQRNVEDAAGVRRLIRQLRELAADAPPLVVAVDQEGGRVQRLREPWTQWPPVRRLGTCDVLDWTQAFARALSRELLDLGIGLNFAPVLDVDTNPANPVIGDRSFGRAADLVARHGVAFLEAMQSAGVAACAKHFPGHGDTLEDSHLELPRVVHDRDRLASVEWAPFMAAARADVASMMTAHVVFEAIDKRRPATFSPDVMAVLREEIGYQGLVFSDDLEMKAVADRYTPVQMVQGAMESGIDALLVCRSQGLVEDVLTELERIPDRLVEDSVARMVAFKARWCSPSGEPIDASPAPAGASPAQEDPPPYLEHQELAALIERGGP